MLKFQANLASSHNPEGRKFQEITVLITEQGVANFPSICNDYGEWSNGEKICLTTQLPETYTLEFDLNEEGKLVPRDVKKEDIGRTHGYLGKELLQL